MSVCLAEHADLPAQVLEAADPDDVAASIERLIGPVVAYDRACRAALLDTLEAYLECMGSVRRTAQRCHTHVNSIYYRLNRIRELLGDGWDRADRVLDVHLAVRAYRLRCGQPSTEGARA